MLSLRDFWLLCILVPTMTISVEMFFTAVQKEYYPTLIDVATEIDRGYGASDKQSRGASLFSPFSVGIGYNDLSTLNSSSLPVDENLRSNLKYSLILGKLKIPLDWSYITAFYTAISGTRKTHLSAGLHNTLSDGYPEVSSYNYDHVSTSYGPGAGSSSNSRSSVMSHSSSLFFPKSILGSVTPRLMKPMSFDDE
jgi:hypothetical protein